MIWSKDPGVREAIRGYQITDWKGRKVLLWWPWADTIKEHKKAICRKVSDSDRNTTRISTLIPPKRSFRISLLEKFQIVKSCLKRKTSRRVRITVVMRWVMRARALAWIKEWILRWLPTWKKHLIGRWGNDLKQRSRGTRGHHMTDWKG